jgi:acetyl-CoA carboxylase carboxyl transferase subunit alpha
MLMLEYSTYSVISPEGCASILWKSGEMAEKAAEAMGMTSARLLELELIDEVVPEPLGGAHRAFDDMAERLRQVLIDNLSRLRKLDNGDLLIDRRQRLMSIGQTKEKQ